MGAMILLAACSPPATQPDAPPVDAAGALGHAFKAKLIDTIERSRRIAIVQHSYEFDLYDRVARRSLIDKELVYDRRELDRDQQRAFLSTIESLPDTTQTLFSACIFEPHHRIEFQLKDGSTSVMEICFGCAQLEWTTSAMTPPAAFYGGLAQFFHALGLPAGKEPGEWRAMAKARLQPQ